MTNFEYYKTPEELENAFCVFCQKQKRCEECKYYPGESKGICDIFFAYGEALKPCPFCGGKAIIRNEDYAIFVECTKCYARSGQELDCNCKEELIERWNKRVGENND